VIAFLTLVAAVQNSFTAQLGKPYPVGPTSYIIGTKEELENKYKRTITLHSVRTAIAFGWKNETYVAREGKKLVIFHATIKNAHKTPISVASADTFGLRIFDSAPSDCASSIPAQRLETSRTSEPVRPLWKPPTAP